LRKLYPLVLSAIFPGIGYLGLHCYVRACAATFLAGLSLNGLIVSTYWLGGPLKEELFLYSLIGFAAVWAVVLFDTARLVWHRSDRRGEKADARLRTAIERNLKGETGEAARLLKKLVHRNPEDREAMCYLADIYKDARNFRKAAKLYRTVIEIGGGDMWTRAAQDELDDIKFILGQGAP